MQTKGRESSSGSRSTIDSSPSLWKTAYDKEIPELSARQLSPLRLLATIIGGVFLAEVVAMLVVYAFRPIPYLQLTLIDAGIMTVLIFPLLYFLSFRPLLRYIQKNQQAEEKNRMLSGIVEQTADTVVVTNRDGVIEYINPAFERMTGYTKEETLGKTPRVLKSGVHNEQFYKGLWDTILSGEIFQEEIANLKRNGELFYEVKTITPLRNDLGEITHFVATGKDITEHKQAHEQLRRAYDELDLRVQERTEELSNANSVLEKEIIVRKQAEETIKISEGKYRSLFNNMSEGFGLHEIILDADGNPYDYRFLEMNAAFERLTGLSREKILNRTVKEVLPEIESSWIETYGKVVLTGEPVHSINFSAPLGKWYEIYCYSPTQNQFAVVFFDVTERKLAEARLKYLATFPEQNPNPILEVDFEGQVRYANSAALHIFPDLRERGMAHAWLADWETVAIPFRDGKSERIVRDLTVEGRFYEQSLYPVLGDDLVRIYGVDITERKRAEAEIQRAAEEVRAANEELKRFNILMVGRELRMIELKKEVNELCASADQPRRYPLEFEKEEQ